MGQEIELKFQIPAHRLAALQRAVATRSARVQALAAVYVDTPGEHLAAARVALRMRLEADQWVQTLKAEDAIALLRHEHNVVLAPRAPGAGADLAGGAGSGSGSGSGSDGDGDGGSDGGSDGAAPAAPDPVRPPAIDTARHAGTPAHALLARVLAEAAQAPGGAGLVARYSTQVQRTLRRVRHQGAVVELALDQGLLRAGPRTLPLAELELELVSGPVSALLDLARRWASRFGLVLDVRSKSERGQGLARLVAQGDAAAEPTSPAARARALALPVQGTPAGAGALMLANCLQQALANASQLANGPGSAEHLHQLRVGLRRLRTVLRLYPGLFASAGDAGPAGLEGRVALLFRELGAQRDQDVMGQTLWPRLEAAGAPPLPAPRNRSRPDADLVTQLRSPQVQALWLDLMALAVPDAAVAAVPEQALAPLLKPPLKRLLRQVRADAAGFAGLDDAARHRLRRRIKRLRYATELCASLWPGRGLRTCLKLLQRAQAPLGELNDNLVAVAHCRALAAQVPEAWFGAGWLSAQQPLLVADCLAPMARLARLRGCWRAVAAAKPAQAGAAAPPQAKPPAKCKRQDKRQVRRQDKR